MSTHSSQFFPTTVGRAQGMTKLKLLGPPHVIPAAEDQVCLVTRFLVEFLLPKYLSTADVLAITQVRTPMRQKEATLISANLSLDYRLIVAASGQREDYQPHQFNIVTRKEPQGIFLKKMIYGRPNLSTLSQHNETASLERSRTEVLFSRGIGRDVPPSYTTSGCDALARSPLESVSRKKTIQRPRPTQPVSTRGGKLIQDGGMCPCGRPISWAILDRAATWAHSCFVPVRVC